MAARASSAWASSLPAEHDRAAEIFRAEAKDGYRDRIVIGGLAGFASRLEVASVADLLHDYAALQPAERASRLEQAQSMLNGGPPKVEKPPPVAPPPRPRVVSPPAGVTLHTRIEALKGVGPVRARLYSRLGIFAVRDLLLHFPARHQPFRAPSPIAQLFFQAEGSVVGTLERLEVESLPRGLKKL